MSNYSRALEFCIENNIILNRDDANSLYLYMEGANIEYIKKLRETSKYFKSFKKNVNSLIKAGGKYQEAKKECEICKQKLKQFQKDINSIVSNDTSDTIAFLIPIVISVGVAFSITFADKKISSNIHNKRVAKMDAPLDKSWKEYINNTSQAIDNPSAENLNKFLNSSADHVNKTKQWNDDFKNLQKKESREGKIVTGVQLGATLGTFINGLRILAKDNQSNNPKYINTFRGLCNGLISNCYKSVAKFESKINKLENR